MKKFLVKNLILIHQIMRVTAIVTKVAYQQVIILLLKLAMIVVYQQAINTVQCHPKMTETPHCKVCNKRCLEQIRTIREEPRGTFLPENYCSIACLEEVEFKKAKKTDKSEQFAARESRAKSSSSKDEQ